MIYKFEAVPNVLFIQLEAEMKNILENNHGGSILFYRSASFQLMHTTIRELTSKRKKQF